MVNGPFEGKNRVDCLLWLTEMGSIISISNGVKLELLETKCQLIRIRIS
jgi:hypothetical protein